MNAHHDSHQRIESPWVHVKTGCCGNTKNALRENPWHFPVFEKMIGLENPSNAKDSITVLLLGPMTNIYLLKSHKIFIKTHARPKLFFKQLIGRQNSTMISFGGQIDLFPNQNLPSLKPTAAST